MKLRTLFIGAALLLSLAACAPRGPVSAQFGTPFTVKVGDTVSLGTSAFTLMRITGDSRCPAKVVCIWAGITTAEIQLSSDRETKTLTIESNKPTIADEYEIELTDVKPAKTMNELSQSDYRLTFVVKLAN